MKFPLHARWNEAWRWKSFKVKAQQTGMSRWYNGSSCIQQPQNKRFGVLIENSHPVLQDNLRIEVFPQRFQVFSCLRFFFLCVCPRVRVPVSQATNQLSASCLPLFWGGQIWRMIHLQVLLPPLESVFFMNIIQNVCPCTRMHARACLRVCTRSFESGAGTGHWMEIMKALVQGPGKEDKFGNSRWGRGAEGGRKGGRAQTSGSTFLHTVSVGVTQSRGGKPSLRVELVCLPEEFERRSRAQEKKSSLLQFGAPFCQKTTSEPKRSSCKWVFLASCWAQEDASFFQSKTKKTFLLCFFHPSQ